GWLEVVDPGPATTDRIELMRPTGREVRPGSPFLAGAGWHAAEPALRWTSGRARSTFANPERRTAIEIAGWLPPEPGIRVRIGLAGRLIGEHVGAGAFHRTYALGSPPPAVGELEIEVSPTFNASRHGGSMDTRELGLALETLALTGSGGARPTGTRP